MARAWMGKRVEGTRRLPGVAGSVLFGALLMGLVPGCASLSFAPGEPQAARDDAQRRLEQSLAEHVPGDLALRDGAEDARAESYPDLLGRMRAGFALPAVEEAAVQRQIDWFLGHPEYLDQSLERGRRYLHHIVSQLEERNMPRELALLPVVESAFDPFARSPHRALGLWQFIPSTGRRYGLEEDWWLDNRRDVLAATRAALDHLQELHDEFDGDWLLALAAYNAGEGSVRRAIERNRQLGEPVDFFHLRLRPETRAYVPKLLAIAQLAAEPERFGLELPSIPDAPYFEPVDVGGQIDLGLLSELTGVPLDELRALNPGFKRFATSPDGPRELLVPAAARQQCEEVLAELPASKRMRYARHQVRRGDTLIAIARRYGVPLEVLRSANRLHGVLIRPGDDLLVPVPARGVSAREEARLTRAGVATTTAVADRSVVLEPRVR
ncbi:MAG TPA: transglycosylase SLT domain-containing protein [Myxococcota bacterium]|nr:transglycosylase SLT domain-containing protein [Myxococcota bacterium]